MANSWVVLRSVGFWGLHIWGGDIWEFSRCNDRWRIEGGGRSLIFSKHVRFTAGHNKFVSGVEQLWSSGLQIWGGAIWEPISCDDRILVSLFRISVLYLFADFCILEECVRACCSEASADMFIGCRTEGDGRCSWTNSRRCEFHSRPLCELFDLCWMVMVSKISYLRGSDLRSHHKSEWSVVIGWRNQGDARSRTNCRTCEMHCGQLEILSSAEWLDIKECRLAEENNLRTHHESEWSVVIGWTTEGGGRSRTSWTMDVWTCRTCRRGRHGDPRQRPFRWPRKVHHQRRRSGHARSRRR